MWRPSDNLTNDITLKYNERLRFHMQKKITEYYKNYLDLFTNNVRTNQINREGTVG